MAKLSMQPDLSMFMPLTNEEKKSADKMPKATSFSRVAMRNLMHNPLAVTSIIILLLILIVIITFPLFCPYGYKDIISIDGVRDITAKNLSPFQYSVREQAAIANGANIFPHIFGTDELCRDYFARVMMGTRISLLVGVFASVIVFIIGSLYGSISGLAGGKTDMIMMRIVDIIYALPDMLIIILLSVVLGAILPKGGGGFIGKIGSNMISLFIVFGLLYWVSMARLVRGQILSIRENDFVQAARLIKTPKFRMIRKHILPNCLSVILVSASLQVPSAIFTESYLSFVGLGVKVPMPSLGALANAARSGMELYPYKLICPAVMIALIVLSFNLLGDGIRDAIDPRNSQ